MLWACARARKPREAYGLFQMMEKQGCTLRLANFNALLCAYEKTSQWENAMRTFIWIQDRGLIPDVTSWSTLISACANAGQPERAHEILERMKTSDCAPNVVSWCGLIKAYQKTGNWQEAELAFQAMLDAGCPPNEVLLFSKFFSVYLALSSAQLLSFRKGSWQFFNSMGFSLGVGPVIFHYLFAYNIKIRFHSNVPLHLGSRCLQAEHFMYFIGHGGELDFIISRHCKLLGPEACTTGTLETDEMHAMDRDRTKSQFLSESSCVRFFGDGYGLNEELLLLYL